MIAQSDTAKTPIKTPQKHRFVWNHHNLSTQEKRDAAQTQLYSNKFTNNFAKVNFLVNFGTKIKNHENEQRWSDNELWNF